VQKPRKKGLLLNAQKKRTVIEAPINRQQPRATTTFKEELRQQGLQLTVTTQGFGCHLKVDKQPVSFGGPIFWERESNTLDLVVQANDQESQSNSRRQNE